MNDIKDKISYLSEDELDKLIADIESEPLADAPAYIDKKILSIIRSNERKKTISFSQYCARVMIGVAVAIFFVCTVPFVPDLRSAVISEAYNTEEGSLVSKEDVLSKRSVKTKAEVLDEINGPGYLEKTEISIRSHIDKLFN